MNPILGELGASDRRLLARRAMPVFTPPMLATLAKRDFSDPAWVFETSHYPDLARGRSAERHRATDRGR
jgi:hypothetical protein